jgi:hypothetical protein
MQANDDNDYVEQQEVVVYHIQEEYKTAKSRFGKEIVTIGGYTYLYDKPVDNGRYWAMRCEQKNTCKGRIYLVVQKVTNRI